jgi:hypothetical protein
MDPNRLEATNWLVTCVTRLGTGSELANRLIPSLAISFSDWPLYTHYMSSTQLSKDAGVNLQKADHSGSCLTSLLLFQTTKVVSRLSSRSSANSQGPSLTSSSCNVSTGLRHRGHLAISTKHIPVKQSLWKDCKQGSPTILSLSQQRQSRSSCEKKCQTWN